jgi:hypothetical protein
MNILHPKTKQPNFNNLSELPSAKGGGSGYYLIALVEQGLDLYVCFCNAERNKVYIEKTTKLNTNKFLCVEDLTFISDESEFSTIYNFLIDNRILNG